MHASLYKMHLALAFRFIIFIFLLRISRSGPMLRILQAAIQKNSQTWCQVPEESQELFTPDSTKPATERPELPRRIAQMFERKHDWKAIFEAFRAWVAAGRGTDKAFSLEHKIPYGSFARHAVKFRRIMAEAHQLVRGSTEVPAPPALEAAPFSSLASPDSLLRGLAPSPASPSGTRPAGLSSANGVELLENASPEQSLFTPASKAVERGYKGALAKLRAKAPELADKLLRWTDSMNPAAIAAVKEAFALLKEAEKDAPEGSPIEKFSDEEIRLLLGELGVGVLAEREIVVDLKSNK